MNDTVDIKTNKREKNEKKCRKAVESTKILRPAKTLLILQLIELVLKSSKILWKGVNDLR